RRRRRVLVRRRAAAPGGRRLPRGTAGRRAGVGRRAPARRLPQRPATPAPQARRRPLMVGPQQSKWFFEATTAVEAHMHALARTRVPRRTRSHLRESRETLPSGRGWFPSGPTQSSRADEFFSPEALVPPGPLARPGPRRALVIGGGEGATVREILRHPTIV